jgi:hypothetical protein
VSSYDIRPPEVEDMTSSTLIKGAAVGLAGAAASLAFSAPASAFVSAYPDPGPGYSSGQDGAARIRVAPEPTPVAADSSGDLVPVATGALGGLLAAGAGFAAFELTRRRTAHQPLTH